MMLLKDYLRDAIKEAGFSHAEISKTPTGTRVALHVTRPGIVIGRKGSGIRELTEKLATDFGLKNPQNFCKRNRKAGIITKRNV